MAHETQTIEVVEVEAMAQTALAWPDRAEAITITDQLSYNEAASLLLDIVRLRKEIVLHHRPIKESANRTHKLAVAAEKKLLDPVSEAESTVKRAIGKWHEEQRAIEEKARLRLEKAQKDAEEEARLAIAQQAEELGATEGTVNEILETRVTRPVSAVPRPTYRKASGVSTQKRWKAEVVDIKALCRGVADGTVSSELVLPNMTGLNAMARAMRTTFNVAGCKPVTEASVSMRSAM